MENKNNPQPDITGIWEAKDKSSKIEILVSGNEIQAKLLYQRKSMEADGVTFKKDTKNPNTALQSRSLKGIIYLTGLKWNGVRWEGGTLYYPVYGGSYKSRAILKNGVLNIRDYVGIPLLGSSIDYIKLP